MEVNNILTVIDIDKTQLSEKLKSFLKNEFQETYTDSILNEHIYNVEDLSIDISEWEEVESDILDEVLKIQELSDKHDAGYFRVIG